ncbi:MAG: cation transporter [Ruminococcaceae bacterium]|nr:cation transporter [Oscillospiraceae bacterium]
MQNRSKQIFKTSIVGIAVNLLLVGFKAAVGMLSNSIAIILDAVNNLSDALSSVITIIGMKLAGKPADKKHPMGYGRIEYLTSAIISVIIIYAGATSLESSIKKIIHPEQADYSAVTLIIVAVAVAVKLMLGSYVKKQGEKVNSDALVASGKDALFDSVISLSTLAAAAVYLIWGVSLEAYLGVVISVIIIKSGLEMIGETLSKILGERVDSELAGNIKRTVCSFDEVQGAYDLTMNNYGPDNYLATIHIEVADTLTAADIDRLTRRIQAKVLDEYNIYIAAVSIYSVNTTDDEIISIKNNIDSIIMSHDNILQIHGFYVDKEYMMINVDIVMSFDEKEPDAVYADIKKQIEQAYPEYAINLAMDTDISD